MTAVKVERESGHIVCVECDGHTDYGEEGEDIVCAALSSVVQTAVLGLMSVVGINVELKRDFDRGYLYMRVPVLDEAKRHDADVILDTMLCGIADLHEGFSKYIKLEYK
ncbi:MAG: ribosomal-processing cysteine protease Prp [Clostridia bacterium]|nr:ribosomal-processing cysteine protease Prp [Clostridia bacterium]